MSIFLKVTANNMLSHSVLKHRNICLSLAHELGHCLMHNGNGLYNHEPSETDNPIEQEANVFASRILAPACVLWGIGVTPKPSKYQNYAI